MPTTPPGGRLVLHEFRLNSAEEAGLVARLVALPGHGGLPLLTSIDDPRDVATLRTADDQESQDIDGEERASLAPFVTSWQPLKRYTPRVAESAVSPSRYYRMAVTESGINDAERDTAWPHEPAEQGATSPIGRLWIGAPVGTDAGLLILVGHYGAAPFAVGPDPSGWPLALSRKLGVRIYEGSASNIGARGQEATRHNRAN